MSTAHSERAHAYLSASGSKRWLSCPPSAKLEQEFPESTSDFAREGTCAHELSELYLQRYLELINKATFTRRHNKFKKDNAEFYSQEMEDYVQVYVDFVIERINAARAASSDAVILLEQRLDFSEWVPKGFGTGDVVIISDNIMEIIDLKYGKGVPVSAEDNSQMRMYALGAINQFGVLYEFDRVQMTIVQPRLDSISTDEISTDDLLFWADDFVKPRADMAIAGEGEFAAGEHCRFCRARFTCRARADANLEMAKLEFQKPDLLSFDEIGEVLAKAEELQKWAKDVQGYALDQAENHGVKFPGWKLVEGRSNRKYTDEQLVAQALLAEGYEEEKIYSKSLYGISAMEKAIGKKVFVEVLKDLVIKPVGKPTLVPESDKRPELNSTESAIADFS
ncbi:DUF2800 domain-containing protein [Bacillus canaveralius]|uniref:DUF2800 domain-containing protein n=1 Tax=Bacillus canaveralius TaxID=1403243 RepID=A0A2N5GPJ1_9BACI|nr:DUF2800 domain-containing protein [Bacillus canaveralius]PLR84634.1 DUF2800 domain-containing protein [Bacillus canaveralius]PLS00786.1 DUF2800 domain-containing protein [Bacillus canaveralius]